MKSQHWFVHTHDTVADQVLQLKKKLVAYEAVVPQYEEAKEALIGECKCFAPGPECQCAERYRQVLSRTLAAAWARIRELENEKR